MTDTTKPRSRNRRGEGGRLREEIVEAASRLLDAGGAQAVTLRAVAREAGIAAPSIYAHFDSPEAIIAELIQHGFAALIADLQPARDGRRDPVDRLWAGCAAYLAFARRRPVLYDLMFQVPAGVDHRDAAPGIQGAAAFALLVQGIEDCVKAGRSTSVDPFRDATALWVGLHGFAGLAGHQFFPWPPEDDLLDRLVTGLGRITPSPH